MERFKLNPDNWNDDIQHKMEDYWGMLQEQFPPMQDESHEAYWERTKATTFQFLLPKKS